ncbi:MAG: hypothetical protein WCW68_12880 [Methanothrix sp.]
MSRRPPVPDRGHGRADRRGARLYALTEDEIGIVEAESRVNEPAKVFKALRPH